MEIVLKKENKSIQCSEKGKFIQLKEIIENLNDGRYKIEIKMIRQQRTVQQNKYLWACYGMIASEVGYISDELAKEDKKEIINALHETFKKRILGCKIVKSKKDKRKKISIVRSTTSLDTHEFSKEYMDKIRALHPYLPSPDDKNLFEFIDTYYYM